jgi:pimeloyl-ACP methyl ester carboxylesterase
MAPAAGQSTQGGREETAGNRDCGPNRDGHSPAADGSSARPLPHVAGVQHAFYDAGPLRMHVAEKGDGPPLVLLHGWPQHWYEWRKLIPPLSEGYRVLCPDLRGFGWSDAPRDGYDKETMARDVLALLDELGVERVNLAGHDWGGWIGFLICQFAPERVERYVALNIALPFSRRSAKALASQWRFWYQAVLAAPVLGPRVVSAMVRRPGPIGYWSGGTRREAWSAEEREIFMSQLSEPERRRASVLLYREFQLREMRWMLSGRYHRMGFKTPALVLHGREDKIVRPAHLEFSRRIAPNLEVEFVDGCGHFIIDERPDLVEQRMLEFFDAGAPARERWMPSSSLPSRGSS